MNTWTRWFLAVLVVLMLCDRTATAQQLFPAIQRIVDNNKLVVAIIAQDVPPMVMTDDDGNPTGFDIDLARTIGHVLGVEVEFVRTSETYDGVVDLVAAGRADVGISNLSRTAERAMTVYFSRPYLIEPITLLINRVRGIEFRTRCPTLAEAIALAGTPGQIGVVAGTSYASGIKADVSNAAVEEFESFDQMLAAAYEGEILASIQSELLSKYHMRENPGDRIHLKICPIPGIKDGIAIAVRNDSLGLVNWLNVFLDDYDVSINVDDIVAHDGKWNFMLRSPQR